MLCWKEAVRFVFHTIPRSSAGAAFIPDGDVWQDCGRCILFGRCTVNALQ